MKEHLFQPFEQEMNSVTTQYGGSGLGLSIVARLVQLMGGRIEAESTFGEGTTFTVYVDCELVEEREVQRELHDNDAKADSVYHVLAGKRMLLAEDHHLNAEIAIRLLEKMGSKIFLPHACDGWTDRGKNDTEDAASGCQRYSHYSNDSKCI